MKKSMLAFGLMAITVFLFTGMVGATEEIIGIVTGVDLEAPETSLTLTLEDGSAVMIDLGPVWLYDQAEFTVGDSVTLTGEFVTVGEFVPYTIIIGDGGTTYVLRDEDGTPLWTNQGNGNGSGSQNQERNRNREQGTTQNQNQEKEQNQDNTANVENQGNGNGNSYQSGPQDGTGSGSQPQDGTGEQHGRK
ncbi:MAG: hypothetical protein NTX88_02235 [Candidatus Atribacteria bacterium]|nr:hypothetical protein [Candidatus Atribacteria bacterium]